MSFSTLKQKKALVTGAGNGIGRQTALLLAKYGATVIVTDMNSDSAKETCELIKSIGGTCEAHTLDVTQRKQVATLAEIVEERHGALDILINNAGIATAGDFLSSSLESFDKVIDVNLKGVINGCHYFLPAMVKAGRGSVVNLSSMAAFIALPDMPSYATTKFAVFGFSEALRGDMAKHNIHVAAICPGIINTGIIQNSIMEGELGKGDQKGKIDAFYKKRNYPPEKVAQAIVKAIVKRKDVVPVSPEAWMGYYLKRFSPKLVKLIAGVDQSKLLK